MFKGLVGQRFGLLGEKIASLLRLVFLDEFLANLIKRLGLLGLNVGHFDEMKAETLSDNTAAFALSQGKYRRLYRL